MSLPSASSDREAHGAGATPLDNGDAHDPMALSSLVPKPTSLLLSPRSVQEDPTNRHNKPPPKNAAFYKSIRRSRLSRSDAYARKLQEGMGVDQQTATAILARASDLLSSHTRLNMNSHDIQAFRDKLIQRLENDPRLGPYFQHSYSVEEYPEACAFFQEVAKNWITLANYLKPDEPRGVSI